MPPTEGQTVPDFEALLCEGETFRPARLSEELAANGAVLVFFGFVFNAISENWWKRYVRAGWHEFDVPVYGIGRDGPYAMNEFLRSKELPFAFFADVETSVADAYDLLTEREGMADVRTAQRAVFVIDGDCEVQYAWTTDEWIYPVPRGDIEEAVSGL